MVEAARNGWLHWDVPKDVVISLRHVADCLILIEANPNAWKWSILALHSALQSAMTCHLSGTMAVGHLSRESAEEWMARRDGPCPSKRWQARPEELFRRLYLMKYRIEDGCGEILNVTKDQKQSFKILNNLRNEFIHFSLDGWILELNGLPRVFLNILDVISAISEDVWPFRHMTEDERADLKSLISGLSQTMLDLVSSNSDR